jgi:hypothetical protein
MLVSSVKSGFITAIKSVLIRRKSHINVISVAQVGKDHSALDSHNRGPTTRGTDLFTGNTPWGSVEHCSIDPRLAGAYGRSLVFAHARDEKRGNACTSSVGVLKCPSRRSAPQPLSGRIAVTVESSVVPPAGMIALPACGSAQLVENPCLTGLVGSLVAGRDRFAHGCALCHRQSHPSAGNATAL